MGTDTMNEPKVERDSFDDAIENYVRGPEITMSGGCKILCDGIHVATLEKGLPSQIEEKFVYTLLNGAADAASDVQFILNSAADATSDAHSKGYHKGVLDVAYHNPPAIDVLRELQAPRVGVLSNRS